jgi:hypothetical protein
VRGRILLLDSGCQQLTSVSLDLWTSSRTLPVDGLLETRKERQVDSGKESK